MNKLRILKAIVDFIWFIWCIPAIVLLALFFVFTFVEPESIKIFYDLNNDAIDFNSLKLKIFVLLVIILVYVGIYCFYLFRKTVRYFQRVKPFHINVIHNFYKIGYLLTIIGLIAALLIPFSRFLIQYKIRLSLGVSPYLALMCLGLFFMVLSEIFKVAKKAKEENDLTV